MDAKRMPHINHPVAPEIMKEWRKLVAHHAKLNRFAPTTAQQFLSELIHQEYLRMTGTDKAVAPKPIVPARNHKPHRKGKTA